MAADVAQKAAQGANGLSDGAIQGGTVGGGILAGALSLKALQSFAEGGLKGLVGNAGGLLKFGAKWAGWIGAAMAIGEVLSEYGPKMIGDPDHPVKDDPLNRMHERNKPTSLEELRRQRDEHDKVLREHGVGGPQLDTAEVERKAQELKEAATVQGVVTMDHSEVDAASAAVRTLIGLIGQANLGFGQIKAGAASAAASAGMVGVLGKTQRGHFATSGPSGEGQ